MTERRPTIFINLVEKAALPKQPLDRLNVAPSRRFVKAPPPLTCYAWLSLGDLEIYEQW